MPDDSSSSSSFGMILAGFLLGVVVAAVCIWIAAALGGRSSGKWVWIWPMVNATILGFFIWIAKTRYRDSGVARGMVISLSIVCSLSVVCGGLLFVMFR